MDFVPVPLEPNHWVSWPAEWTHLQTIFSRCPFLIQSSSFQYSWIVLNGSIQIWGVLEDHWTNYGTLPHCGNEAYTFSVDPKAWTTWTCRFDNLFHESTSRLNCTIWQEYHHGQWTLQSYPFLSFWCYPHSPTWIRASNYKLRHNSNSHNSWWSFASCTSCQSVSTCCESCVHKEARASRRNEFLACETQEYQRRCLQSFCCCTQSIPNLWWHHWWCSCGC